MTIDRFGALADSTRRQILLALAASGLAGRTAGQLARDLGRGRPLVSYHLARLVEAGLAIAARDPADGRRRIYRAASRVTAASPGPARQGVADASQPARRHPRTLVPPADAVLGTLADGSGAAGTRAAGTRAAGGPQPLLGSGLPPETRARLGGFLRGHRAPAGQLLFSQEDPPSGIWFVESGAVRLYTSDADGREQTLQIARAGSSFNEVPFFDLGPEPATAQVLDDAQLMELPIARRDEILRAVPDLSTAAAASFAFRLRQAIALVEDLSFRQVAGRVARVLLQAVAPHPGVGAGSGGRLLTQREIAEMVGSSREVVARTLRQLERDGLIRVERGRIVLLDRAGLAGHT